MRGRWRKRQKTQAILKPQKRWGTTTSAAAVITGETVVNLLQSMVDGVLGKHGDCASQNLSPLTQKKGGLLLKILDFEYMSNVILRCLENSRFSKHVLSENWHTLSMGMETFAKSLKQAVPSQIADKAR